MKKELLWFLLLISIENLFISLKMSNFKKPIMVRIQNSLSIDMIQISNKKYELGKYPVTIAKWKQEKLDNYEKMKPTKS
ncbi:MAG TPA: hypothetical protein EYG94_03505 [Campylobacterales bacterium]|nr:hypothetical protein [Campylobacterales bacterium]